LPSLLSRLRHWWRPPPIAETDWLCAMRACPLAMCLSIQQQARLRELAAFFLARKAIQPVAGLQLDHHQRLLIAVQACIPLLAHGRRALDGWHEVIVYPGPFRVRRHRMDRAGVVTERDDVLAGEAWERGPLVLSWSEIEDDLATPWHGRNVVVHEMAHKLDMLDGGTDGVPLLRDRQLRQRWIEVFQQAYDRLHAAVRHHQHTLIDPYAAENAGEYFAVVSELHYSAPDVLEHAEPQVAALLQRFYGPSPAPRLRPA
jgi:Mlc titration factor MtfA (ptsG expression regulator)